MRHEITCKRHQTHLEHAGISPCCLTGAVYYLACAVSQMAIGTNHEMGPVERISVKVEDVAKSIHSVSDLMNEHLRIVEEEVDRRNRR